MRKRQFHRSEGKTLASMVYVKLGLCEQFHVYMIVYKRSKICLKDT